MWMPALSRTLAILILGPLAVLGSGGAPSADDQLVRGRRAIQALTGCFLVDYSYAETDSPRPGYTRDPRVYDVNRDKSVKEWILADVVSARRMVLQRVLFATDLGGVVKAGSEIKHQAEDWEYDAPFLYDFVGPLTWHVKDLRSTPGLWTRRVTNLDEGLRYQCAARWRGDTAYPEWSCSNYAPIPGRETRDMGRADYNTLDRTTRIIVYGSSWLERQDNVKIIHGPDGRTPLAREVGKNWYVRLADSECSAAMTFARPRQAFWALLRATWDEVFTGASPFVEKAPAGQPPRFVKMREIEDDFLDRDLSDPSVSAVARERILKVIDDYRAR
jgi:hypothetical protein